MPRRARVRGEIRITRPRAHDDHLAGLQAFDGLPLAVELAYRLHADGRQHTALHTNSPQRTAQSEGIDDRGTHAHLIALHAVETLPGPAQPAEDVAAADDDADLHSHVVHLLDLLCILGQTLFVDAVTLFAHKALPAQLEENPFEFNHNDILFSACLKLPMPGHPRPQATGNALP